MSAKKNSVNTVIVSTTTSVNGTISAMNKADTTIEKKLDVASMKKLNKKNRKAMETAENVKNAPTPPDGLNRGETIAVYDELVRRLIANGGISGSGIANIGCSDGTQPSAANQVTSAHSQNEEQQTSLPPPSPSAHGVNNNNHKNHDNNIQYKQSKQISKSSCSNNGIAATIINDDGSVTVQCNGSYPGLSTKFVRDKQDQPSSSSPGYSERYSLPKPNNGPIQSNPSVETVKPKSHMNLFDASISSSCYSNIVASTSSSSEPNLQTPKTVASIKVNDIEISIKEYVNELQMPDLIRVIQKDLSEPYSIYTYRYFIHNWPKLCFLAMDADKCIGAIVCKLDVHRQTIRRGYIAMLAVDKDYRKLKVGTTLVHKAIEVSISSRLYYIIYSLCIMENLSKK